MVEPLKRTKEEQKMLDDIEKEPNVQSLAQSAHVDIPTDKELSIMLKDNVDTRDADDPEVLLQAEVEKENALKKKKAIDLQYKKAVQPLATNIITTDVKEKTVEGYFNQISHNFFIGAKAIVFICRDIVLARNSLTAKQYDKLEDSLSGFLSRTTIAKYSTIGECDRLYKKLKQNLLPLNWTTQYQLAKLSDEDWKKVEPHLTATTTMSEIDEILEKDNAPKPPVYEYNDIEEPKDFIRIACAKGSQDAVLMTKLSQQIQKLIDEINVEKVDYFLNKDDDGQTFYCEMSVNEKFITQTDDKALKFMKNSKVGGIATRYFDAKSKLPHTASFLRSSINDFMKDKAA